MLAELAFPGGAVVVDTNHVWASLTAWKARTGGRYEPGRNGRYFTAKLVGKHGDTYVGWSTLGASDAVAQALQTYEGEGNRISLYRAVVEKLHARNRRCTCDEECMCRTCGRAYDVAERYLSILKERGL